MTATTFLEWEDQANGSNNNTWGDVSDANSTIFEQAIARLGSISTTGGTTTLSSAQNRYPIIALTGVLVSNATIVVRTAEKNWAFINNTTGAFSVTVKTLAGTGKAIPRGRATNLYCDGANVINARQVIVPSAIAGGTVDAITATFEPAFAAADLTDGTLFVVESLGANLTTTPTFNPDTLGGLTITKSGNQVLTANDIPRAGLKMLLCYRASAAKYELLNPVISSPYGLKNRIINGDMRIAQRGTSFATPVSGAYTLDRWGVFWAGAAPSNVAQVAGPTGFSRALWILGAVGNTVTTIYQRIESLNVADLVGQNVVLSVNISASVGQTIAWSLVGATAPDNYAGSTFLASGTWTVTTSAQTFSAAISAIGANVANGVQLGLSPQNGGPFTSGTVTITGAQLELGATATQFEWRDQGDVIQQCQRYYQSFTPTNIIGYCQATNTALFFVPYLTPMRGSPSVGFSGCNVIYGAGLTTAALSNNSDSPSISSTGLSCTTAAVLTVGQACRIQSGLTVNVVAEL